MEIREYKKSDREDFIRLTEGRRRYVMDLDNQNILAISKDYGKVYSSDYIKNTKGSRGAIFMAETDEKTVGCGVGIIRKLSKKEELKYNVRNYKMGVISNLFIEESYRGKGIGTQLIHKFEEFFKEHGCKYVRMEVFALNEKAYDLYAELGYKDYLRDLCKKI
ncbi:GNAT family N-acetyltransferase [candidate division WS5 bacterium]|uniref:GNAT family N-acetyltransferase n=1 Tax=candidate division WS5 bacterium TaxID=2093353 RepID=A0A419DBR7_9BACT|nr:MAG: GNAT family N-acetyltransferase [candidate division WS5 bacterium]